MDNKNNHLDLKSVTGTFHLAENVSLEHKFVSFEVQSNSILSNFEFEKVHKVMVALDWKWFVGDPDVMRVPTIEEIKAEAYRLLIDCYLTPTSRWMIATGGLRVNKDDGLLQLQFVVDEWDLYGYDDQEIEELEKTNGQN
jgi:hypothetical protein